MKRKLISWSLVLAMVCSMVPTVAFAAEGDNTEAGNLRSALETGDYTLQGDVVLGATLTITAGAELDLNGYDISACASGYSLITVNITDDSTFTLTDSNGNNAHGTRYGAWGDEGDAYTLSNTSSTGADVIVGGVITGGIVSTINTGGGVTVIDGDFMMSGGNIAGNQFSGTGGSSGNGGGGVHVKGGSFTMDGGSIVGNYSKNNGGGVFAGTTPSTFTLTDGTISNNKADAYGGGLYADYLTTISSGTISNNSAMSGGGGITLNSGTLNMTGGTVTGNVERSNKGDGIQLHNGTFNISGNPTIEKNGADNNGDGVYLASGKKFTVVDDLTTTIPFSTAATCSAAAPVTVAVAGGEFAAADLDADKFVKAKPTSNGELIVPLHDEIQVVIWSYSQATNIISATSDSNDSEKAGDGGKVLISVPTEGLTYDGTGKPLVQTPVSGAADWTAAELPINYFTTPNGRVAPSNAGTYKAIIFDPTNGSTQLLNTEEYTITPKEVTLTWDENPTYTGEEQTMEATVEGYVGDTAPTITYGGTTTATDASDFVTATASISNRNYTIKSGDETHNWRMALASYDAANFEITGIQDSYEYTGSAFKPTPVVKYTAGDSDVTLTANTDYTVGYMYNTNVAKSTDENAPVVIVSFIKNHSGNAKQTFTITPKEITVPTYTNQSVPFTGAVQDPQFPAAVAGDYTCVITPADDIQNIGEYTATYTLTDKDNTVWADAETGEETDDITFTYTITPKEITAPTYTNQSVAFTGAVQDPQFPDAVDGDYTCEVTPAGDIKDIGVYTATYTLTDSDNTVWADAETGEETDDIVFTYTISYGTLDGDLDTYLTLPEASDSGWYEGGEAITAASPYTICDSTGAELTAGDTIPSATTTDAGDTKTVYVKDEDGNVYALSVPYKVDTTEPTIDDVTVPDASGDTLTFNMGSSTTPISGVEYTVDGGATVDGDDIEITEAGTYTVTATTGAGVTSTYTITVWEVTFDADNGTDSATTLVTDGGKVTQPESDPEKDNYAFDCWQLDDVEFAFDTATISETTTITANWLVTPLNPDDVTITAPEETDPAYDGQGLDITAPEAEADSGFTYTYQWYKKDAEGNWQSVEGATAKDFNVSDVADNGEYCVGLTVTDGDKESEETLSTETITVDIQPKEITDFAVTGTSATFGDDTIGATVKPLGTILDSEGNEPEIEVEYKYVGADGTEYDSETIKTAPAGEYDVIVTSKDPNYTFPTEAVTTLSIAKAPVSVGTSIDADGNLVVTSNTDHITPEDFDVTYYDKDGAPVAADALVDGETYTVKATLKDEALADHYIQGNGSSATIDLGEYTPGGKNNVIDFAGTPITAQPGAPIVVPAGADNGEAPFLGWEIDGVTYKPGDTLVVPTGDVEVTPVYGSGEATGSSVVGTVNDSTGAPVNGAVITLKQGNTVVAEAITDATGAYAFADVAPGTYAMVTTAPDGTTSTVKVVIPTDGALTNTLPLGKTSAIVDVKPGSPAIVVDKLDSELPTTGSDSVEVKMTVEQTGADADVTAHMADDNKNATVGLTLDINIEKTTTLSDSSQSVADITNTANLIEIIVPIPAALQGKDGYKVYRSHDDGTGTVIDEIPQGSAKANTDGEYFEMNEGDTSLTLHVKKFSIYAIATVTTPASSGFGGGLSSSHTSSLSEPENGSYEVSNSKPKRGDTVTITPTPDEGYEVASVTVTYSNGKTVKVTANDDGTFSYIQPSAGVTITVDFQETGAGEMAFTDVSQDDWFYDAVKWAAENGITTGKTDTTFAPYDVNTRAEVASFLWRAKGCEEVDADTIFTDVADTAWYHDAIIWATEKGITNGTMDGTTYSPDWTCDRSMIITMIWRMMGSPAVEAENPFVDVADDAWYADAVLWAVSEGITTGTSDDAFSPTQSSNRAEIITFLYRALAD